MMDNSQHLYDIAIIGAGPGGIFTAFSLLEHNSELNIAIFDAGRPLEQRHCPIDGQKIKTCIHCKPSCAIMNGFGGAGAFSDGKYNITTDFGGTLHEKIGTEKAMQLMERVDHINCRFGEITDDDCKKYSSHNSRFHTLCLQNNLKLQNATIRHLGTDLNYKILTNMYKYLVQKGVQFYFNTPIHSITHTPPTYLLHAESAVYECTNCIVAVGRSGHSFIQSLCQSLDIPMKANRADIGVRVELPYEVFAHLTEELYESKIVYTTKTYEDKVRTFCMNPHGIVVNENTNGIVTVNGHAYEDTSRHTANTNFALLVGKKFTEPFNDSVAYCESIARLSNMLGGGVIVQRFGDLIRGRRTTDSRLQRSTTRPTLQATPGDLSLVLPKRILDDIIETIYALNNIAPGTANDDTLLYGVETKLYNNEVAVDKNLETKYKGLFIIGDGSGVTHSLAQSSASGLYVGECINGQMDGNIQL